MDQVAEKSHARLGPSGWDRWNNCPGSPALSDSSPNKSSIYAAEGTVCHEISDRILKGEAPDGGHFLDQMFHVEGFDIIVDEEMAQAADFYVDYVRSLVNEDSLLMPEQPVPVGHLTGEEGATGTSDTIIITGNVMDVVDLKYGKGVRVDAEGNGQGRMYALGALQKYGMIYDIDEVRIHIVMPRMADGITVESLNIGELEEHRDIIEIAAGRVAMADGEFKQRGADEQWVADYLRPGEKQCKFCPAARAGNCPALLAETSRQLAVISDCTAEDFADLTLPKQAASLSVRPEISNERLAEFMRAVPLIEAAISGVRAEVERRLFDGQQVPGYYLGVGKKGRRSWADEEAAKKAVVKRGRLTKDQAFELKLISPTQAEKLLGKDTMALLKEQGLITQADGKPSVCREGDKNAPYVPVSADDFADLTADAVAQRLLD